MLSTRTTVVLPALLALLAASLTGCGAEGTINDYLDSNEGQLVESHVENCDKQDGGSLGPGYEYYSCTQVADENSSITGEGSSMVACFAIKEDAVYPC